MSAETPDGSPPPPIDFVSFIASLATNALAALGALPDGCDDLPQQNPTLAREYIDILAMLEEKTRGNLTEREARVLAQILADVRLAYGTYTK